MIPPKVGVNLELNFSGNALWPPSAIDTDQPLGFHASFENYSTCAFWTEMGNVQNNSPVFGVVPSTVQYLDTKGLNITGDLLGNSI
jgi:hypothetical protein